MWLFTMAVFFSIAGMFHRYYMVMLAPAIAALVGAGIVALWSDYRSPGRRGWLLPLTLAGMAALQAYIVLTYYDEDWSYWLTAVVVGLCLVAAAALVVLRLRPSLNVSVYAAGMVAVGVLALLIAPTVWAAYTAWQGSGRMAAAGPQTVQGSSRGGPGGGPRGGPWGGRDAADPVLMDYLQANRGDARYLVATTNAMSASPIILNTDEPAPVIALGGFAGRDPVLSTDEVAGLVDEGAVRFFLVQDRERMREMMANEDDSSQQPGQQGPPQGFPGGGRGFPQNEATSWVQDNCEKIPQELWQSPEAEEGPGALRLRPGKSVTDDGQDQPRGMAFASTMYPGRSGILVAQAADRASSPRFAGSREPEPTLVIAPRLFFGRSMLYLPLVWFRRSTESVFEKDPFHNFRVLSCRSLQFLRGF
jgi:4-amino-4-deoxy-L-arabinose transferase-like glycosyltransferase